MATVAVTPSEAAEEMIASVVSGSGPRAVVLDCDMSGNLTVRGTVTGSQASAFGDLAGVVTDAADSDHGGACYVVFRTKPDAVIFIMWVPETTPIRSKMFVATSADGVKRIVGYKAIEDELHFTEVGDIDWAAYQHSHSDEAREALMSATEREWAQADREEETARAEQISEYEERMREIRGGGGGGGAVGRVGGKKARPQSGDAFHTIDMPLSDSAEEELGRFKRRDVNYVPFSIVDETIEAFEGSELRPRDLADTVAQNEEAGFYLFEHTLGTGGIKKTVFIYCVPETSKPKSRMPYATAKPALVASIEARGIEVHKTLEVTDGAELTREFLNEELSASTRPKSTAALRGVTGGARPGGWVNRNGGGTSTRSPRTKTAAVAAEHPIYGLMSEGSASRKKKIVLPPKGAYGGY